MKSIIITIIVFFLSYRIFNLYINIKKDRENLAKIPLQNKINPLIIKINEAIYNGEGSITILKKNELQLYKPFTNHIVCFYYKNEILFISWKYKFMYKEIKYYKKIKHLYLIPDKHLNNIATDTILEMSQKINNLFQYAQKN